MPDASKYIADAFEITSLARSRPNQHKILIIVTLRNQSVRDVKAVSG